MGGILGGLAPGQAPEQVLGLLDGRIVGGPHEQLVARRFGPAAAR
jgi:hypothetical protein